MDPARALPLALVLAAALTAAAPMGAGPAQSSSQAATVVGAGAIIGRVVDGDTGQPVADAVVTLIDNDSSRSGGSPTGRGIRFTTPPAERIITGADGRFVFHGLRDGSYRLDTGATGYVRSTNGQSVATELRFRSIVIRPDQRVVTTTLRIWRQATLEGRVLDEAGEPVVAATVQASRLMAAGSSSTHQARTDDRGWFRFGGLTPGSFVVSVPQSYATAPAAAMEAFMQGMMGGGSIGGASLSQGAIDPTAIQIGDLRLASTNVRPPMPGPDGRLFVYPTQYYGGDSAAAAEAITLVSGENRTGVELALRLVEARRITGRVTGPDGPIAGIAVSLQTGDDASAVLGRGPTTGTTLPDGSFTILGVPPGQYFAVVEREPPPEMPAEMASNPVFKMAMAFGGQFGQPLYGGVEVHVGSADVHGVSIVAGTGITVSGRVEFDGDVNSEPLPTASIGLQSLGGRGSYAAAKAIDAESRFTVDVRRPGRYRVTGVAGAGRAPWLIQSVRLDGADVTRSGLVAAGTNITGLVVTFTNRLGRLSGSVRGVSDGVDAVVIVLPADLDPAVADRALLAEALRRNPVSAQGRYESGAMLPGEYLVLAVDSAELVPDLSAQMMRRLAALATRTVVAAGSPRVLDLSLVTVR